MHTGKPEYKKNQQNTVGGLGELILELAFQKVKGQELLENKKIEWPQSGIPEIMESVVAEGKLATPQEFYLSGAFMQEHRKSERKVDSWVVGGSRQTKVH